MTRLHSLILGLAFWVLGSSAGAFRVLDIQSDQAQGLNSAVLPSITIPQGHTITLSFIPTGHVIQSIWLDDPAWVVLSTDTPLCQQMGDTQAQGGCGAASVMRIRQLSDPLAFAANERTRLVQDGQLTTFLTVLAADSSGGRYVYQFVLELSHHSTNTYSLVRIVPTVNQPPGIVMSQSLNQLSQIRRGLQRAQQENLIDASSPEWSKLQTFLDYASAGTVTVETAIAQSGVSREFIYRLLSMGAP